MLSNRRPFGAIPLILAISSACADAQGDPLASVTAEEARGALVLEDDLRDAMALARAVGREDITGLSVWVDSWSLASAESRSVRESVYPALASELANRMSEASIAESLLALRSALDAGESIPREELPERIAERLDLARDAQLRGSLAAQNGDLVRAVTELLRGTDLIKEVEPVQVANQLLSAADQGMRRLLATESYSELTRQRAQSLIRIAQGALKDRDYTRAIRNAYYATLLLDVDVP